MYLYSYRSAHVISGLAAGGAWEQFEGRLKMTIKWTERNTCTWWLCELRNARGGCNRDSLEMHLDAEIMMNSEMHLEAMIDWVWRCIWRPQSCNSEMHMDTVIERVWRWTWRPTSFNSEMHLEAVIERVWRCARRSWSSKNGGVLGGGQ